jgi:hypothetical protein
VWRALRLIRCHNTPSFVIQLTRALSFSPHHPAANPHAMGLPAETEADYAQPISALLRYRAQPPRNFESVPMAASAMRMPMVSIMTVKQNQRLMAVTNLAAQSVAQRLISKPKTAIRFTRWIGA